MCLLVHALVHYKQPRAVFLQIGRSSETQIDFTVVDTNLTAGLTDPPELGSPESHNLTNGPVAGTVPGGSTARMAYSSTISRYACRILIDRSPPYQARIFAAGFDASRNIFLGVSLFVLD